MSTAEAERIELPGAELRWWPDLLSPAAAQSAFEVLREGLDWQQGAVRMFGREIAEPRLTCWYGDAGARYRYSGRELVPLPWTPELARLRDLVAAATGEHFTTVLGNLYRDGSDHVGWHADDEPELGRHPVIASLSLGAARRMQFRPRPRGPIALQRELPAGSLLVMSGATQEVYHHRIPATTRPIGPRINLTFRAIATTLVP